MADASVLVAAWLRGDANHGAARKWLENYLGAGIGPLLSPAIALAEVAGALRRALHEPADADALVRRFLASSMVEFVEVDRPLAVAAARHAIELGLKGCDAVYVALAVTRNDLLVTLDREQAGRSVGKVATLVPSS